MCEDFSTDVSTYFDQINFDKLPDSFVIKCNHGCKWQYRIKKKDEYLKNKRLFEIIKNEINDWLNREFWAFQGFEMQYATSSHLKNEKGIKPKLLIEEYMPESSSIEIYCFNGEPKIYAYIEQENRLKICIYNSDYSYSDLVLKKEDRAYIREIPAKDILKQAVELSKTLSKEFNFVRVDWIVYKERLFFEELTFTPYSGFSAFSKEWERKLGEWIRL